MMWWEFLAQKAWVLELEEFNWNAEAFLCRVKRYLMLFCIQSAERKKKSERIKLCSCVVKLLKAVSNLLQITKSVQSRKDKEETNISESHCFITA